MILGIFSGTTVDALKGQRLKIVELQQQFDDNKSKALADRTAAIAELKAEIDQIASL